MGVTACHTCVVPYQNGELHVIAWRLGRKAPSSATKDVLVDLIVGRPSKARAAGPSASVCPFPPGPDLTVDLPRKVTGIKPPSGRPTTRSTSQASKEALLELQRELVAKTGTAPSHAASVCVWVHVCVCVCACVRVCAVCACECFWPPFDLPPYLAGGCTPCR